MTRPSRGAVVLLALVIVIVGLIVGLVMLLARDRAAAEAEGRDMAVLAAARQTAVNMFTVDGADPKGSLGRVAAGATGEFREQLVSQTDEFGKAIAGARAGAQGSVSEAGIRAVTDDRAAVLVSAIATVHNNRTPQGQALQYRMVLELQRKDSGWLVSRLEFVP
jgi:Mce-associated membrane protein